MLKRTFEQPHMFSPQNAKRWGLVNAIVYQGLIQQIEVAAFMKATYVMLPEETKCYRFEPDDLCRYFSYLQLNQIVEAIDELARKRKIEVWMPKAADAFWIGLPTQDKG